MRRTLRALIDTAHWLSTQREDLTLALEEVRAVLAPLLADPHFGADDWCVFCYDGDHTPDCPVRRAAALLGTAADQARTETT